MASSGGDTPSSSLPFPKRDVSTSPSPSQLLVEGHHALRQATLVLPETGDRVKRSITLRDPKIFGLPSSSNQQQPGSSSNAAAPAPAPSPARGRARRLRDWIIATVTGSCSALMDIAVSRAGQGVLKCSIAYLVATMAVFMPLLTPILGAGDGKHLVANIVIWFHPARSIGNMDHGVILGFFGWLYGASIAYASMSIATLFNSHDLLSWGHAVVLIVCGGGGMGFIAWYKQYRNDPLVNVACSVASIPIVTTLTKDRAILEGYFSHKSTTQVLLMMFMALSITVLANLIIFPILARKDAKENLTKATKAYAIMLAGITSAFLTGSEDDLKHPALLAASDTFKTAYAALDQNLADSKFEHFLKGTEQRYRIEERLVNALRRLSQDIGGLRSAASIQFSLLAESAAKPTAQDQPASQPKESVAGTAAETSSAAAKPAQEGAAGSSAIARDFVASTSASPTTAAQSVTSGEDPFYSQLDSPGHRDFSLQKPPGPSVTSAAHIFATFIDELGPPTKSLAFTLNNILTDLPLGRSAGFANAIHPRFRPSLASAIDLFTQSRKDALDLVYKSKEITQAKSEAVAADFEEVASSCGHFSSSLQDLAEGVLVYLDTIQELEIDVNKGWHGLSWNWLCFWRRSRIELPDDNEAVPPARVEQDADFPLHIPSLATRRYYTYTAKEEKPALARTLRYRLWKGLHIFRRDDIRFAIKVGTGAVILISMAYIPATQATFHEWRLEWGIATYMFVCAMSIGAANAMLLPRIRGTLMGAILAIGVWIVARGNPFVLAFLCWLVSVFAFYTMLVRNQAAQARFMLLTFNLSVLYSYSLSINDVDDDPDNDKDEGGVDPQIWEIVFHRLTAVAIGVLCGLFVTQAIWPISARRKLKAGLSLLWLRMGLIWKRAPLSVLIDEGNERPPSYMDIREETKLRAWADTLDSLRHAAESEFSLRGPFMSDSYEALLKSAGRMLDGFHALSVVTAKDSKATRGEQEILRFTAKEREQLAQRISHLFYVLASSVKLQFPLSETLPDIRHTRDRLLAKVYHFRQDDSKRPLAGDQDFEVLYAYALVTAQLAIEIDISCKEIENLYGYLDENMLKLE